LSRGKYIDVRCDGVNIPMWAELGYTY
jgi:hypothetical protein